MATKSKTALAGHTAGIFAAMALDGPEIGTLVVVVDRARNLPNRKTMGKQDPYCAMRLGKEAKKTDTDRRGGQTPKWDQELRFTVHDSPDYYRLKVSCFNDDKKTDLIGDAFVDLRDLVKPGGGSIDLWQQLNYKGKYAGDIRIELTYYDMRPREERVSERRRNRETTPTVTDDMADYLAPSVDARQLGPRELRRRPLPAVSGQNSLTQTPLAAAKCTVDMRQRLPSQQPPREAYEDHPQHHPDPHAYAHTALQPVLHQPVARHPAPSQSTHSAPVPPPKIPLRDRVVDSLLTTTSPNELETTGKQGLYDLGQRVHEDPYQLPKSYERFQPVGHGNAMYRQDGPRRHSGRPPPATVEDEPSPDEEASNWHLQHPHRQFDVSPSNVHQEYNFYDEPEDYDRPPPPPVHAQKTQSMYAPSAYPVQASRQSSRRPSVEERSPLQFLEKQYDSHTSYFEHSTPQPQNHQYSSAHTPPTEEHSRGYASEHSQQLVKASHIPQLGHYRRQSSYDSGRRLHEPNERHIPYHNIQQSASDPNIPQAIPRKAVSPGGSSDYDGRRMSAVPFGPDAYDVLNPASSPVTNENTIFETPGQARQAARLREAERSRDLGPIIGNDGREIDPSDHLPEDTWAPEPERKGRPPEHVVHFRTKHASRTQPIQASSPALQRMPAPRSMQSSPMTGSPASLPSPGGRNRLQKPMPSRPLPAPAQQTSPSDWNTVSPPTQRPPQQRHSYHDGSSPYRPSPGEYQVPAGNSYAPRGVAYADYNGTQPRMPVVPGGYSNDPLAAELSTIDIGPSRGARTLVRPHRH